jgi:hypothetical protein
MEKEIDNTAPEERAESTEGTVSRRDALKRMVKIALGLGAATILPSALSQCRHRDYDDYYDYYSNYYSNYYSDYYYNYYSDYYYNYYSNYGY